MRDRVGMEAEVVVAEAGRAWAAFWEAGLASSFSSAVALQSMRVYSMVGDSHLSFLSWLEKTLINASTHTVDGGHRAIKYSRFGGVKHEIYNEGTHLMVSDPLSPFDLDRFLMLLVSRFPG